MQLITLCPASVDKFREMYAIDVALEMEAEGEKDEITKGVRFKFTFSVIY